MQRSKHWESACMCTERPRSWVFSVEGGHWYVSTLLLALQSIIHFEEFREKGTRKRMDGHGGDVKAKFWSFEFREKSRPTRLWSFLGKVNKTYSGTRWRMDQIFPPFPQHNTSFPTWTHFWLCKTDKSMTRLTTSYKTTSRACRVNQRRWRLYAEGAAY